MTDPTPLSATELAAAIARRTLSSTEAVRAYLARIERLNPELNAVIHLEPERALAAAARADRRSPAVRLHGVPMTLKDSHRVAGMPTIVGNPDASRVPARRDGFVASRLRAEGAVLIGKTNVARDLEDFQTDNPIFGRTNNPLDPSRTPGGSSGGAAAALAAHLTPIEVGSDIAGSVRLPAAFCGVIGLKPTFAAIPTAGHITEPVAHPRGGGVGALASIGPMARSFDDILLLLDVLGGPRDASTFNPAATSLGIIGAFDGIPVVKSIGTAITEVAREARRNQVHVEHVTAPADLREHHRTWVDVHAAAVSTGASWSTSVALGRRRVAAREAWDALFGRFDAVLLPAVMCGPFTHRPTGTPIEVDGQPIPYWRLSAYTEPFNLTAHPAIAFPVGADASGLPIGVQLVARHGQDRWLVRAAAWLAALMPAPSLPA
jgi:amidase